MAERSRLTGVGTIRAERHGLDLDPGEDAVDLRLVTGAEAATGRVQRTCGDRQAQRVDHPATAAESDAERSEHRIAGSMRVERGEARAGISNRRHRPMPAPARGPAI